MNILILGANGRISRLIEQELSTDPQNHLTLYLRNAGRLADLELPSTTIIEGDVTNEVILNQAMAGQDIVYANLEGPLTPLVEAIINAMDANHVKRLIYTTGLGVYNEVPGKFGEWMKQHIAPADLADGKLAVKLIEDSDLVYTIIRAAYMTDEPVVNYELTQKGQPFTDTLISRRSVADLATKILRDPALHQQESLGIGQPGTASDFPKIPRYM